MPSRRNRPSIRRDAQVVHGGRRDAGMRAARPLLIYVAGIFLLGAFAAYPLYRALDSAGLALFPFHVFVFRLLEVFALAGLWPLLRGLGLRGRAQWGWGESAREFLGRFLAGVALGAASLLLLALPLFLLGVRVLDPGYPRVAAGLAWDLGLALGAALLIALIEETWFRGALYSALRRQGGVGRAIAVSALIYAALHFFRPDTPVMPDDAGWGSALAVIADSFGRFREPAFLGPFLALAAAGVWLALMRERTGGIGLAVGTHAGWVVVIKLVQRASDVDHASPFEFLAAGYDGVIGYLGFLWFGALAFAYYRCRPRSRAAAPAGAADPGVADP